MKTLRSITTLFSLALPFCTAAPQRLTVLLDPARGGTENGAHIDEHTPEKQVTLDLANRLRALLNARDFNVVLTRETDAIVTNDTRATLANQARPVACLLLHATAAGKGLHLFTSSLAQAAPQTVAVPWDEAQAPFVQRSQQMERELSTAFGRSKIPVSSGHTWIRPLDNMQCPALALEIAPDGDGHTAADHTYQTRIADAIAGAMLSWRGHADVMQSIVGPSPAAPSSASSPQVGGTPQVVKTPQVVGPKTPAPAGTTAKAVPTLSQKPAAGTSSLPRIQAARPVAPSSAAPNAPANPNEIAPATRHVPARSVPAVPGTAVPKTLPARPTPVRTADGSSPQ